MNYRTFISLFLLSTAVSIIFVPNGDSQSNAASTTMTIKQPPPDGCAMLSLAFSAHSDDVIAGAFGSDVSISFYILSQDDFNTLQNCRLPASVRPNFIEENIAGFANSYSTLIHADGTYYFVFTFIRSSSPGELASGYATVRLSYPASVTLITPGASITGTSIQIPSTRIFTTTYTSTSTSTSYNPSLPASPGQSTNKPVDLPPAPPILIAVVMVALGIIAAALTFKAKRKGKAPIRATSELESAKEHPVSNVSTGYPQLDAMLGGGLPINYAIIVVSPPFDERDRLFANMIKSYVSSGYSVFFVSRDLSRTRDLSNRFKENFHAFNPQADKIPDHYENIFKIEGVQNLNDINISLGKAMESMLSKNPKKLLIMDILSDVLLEHKALTTRKWLDDFLAKRKTENFTVLSTLNPLIVSDQERQTVIDLFDGVIEIYEKEYAERPRRYVIIRKMYEIKYRDMPIELDRDRLV